jgi:chromosome partitioning protein
MSKLRTIAVASARRGTGKSSVCATLAVQACAEGSRVGLLDWEPQGSLTFWWLQRGKPTNPELIRDTTPDEAIAQLQGRADWLFLDTAPAMLEQLEMAIEAADFVLIPVLASGLGLIAAQGVVSLCQRRGIPFAFVINRENSLRKTLNGSAANHLKKLGVLLPATLHDRAAYVSTMMHGLTAPEHTDGKQARPAADEVKALWAAVKKAANKAGVAR